MVFIQSKTARGLFSSNGLWLGILVGLVALGTTGCRCDSPSPEALTADERGPVVDQRCVRNFGQVTLRVTAQQGLGDQRQWTQGHRSIPGVAAPFSVEVGAAVAGSKGFWVSAQRKVAGGYEALLVHIAKTGQSLGAIRSLGIVPENSGPPRLTTFDNPSGNKPGVVVAMQQVRGTGFQLRFARIAAGSNEVLSWQPGPAQAADESNSYDLAAYSDSLVVVWDEWDRQTRRGAAVVSWLGSSQDRQEVAPNSPEPVAEHWALSEPGSDAEAPRLALRPGGYWAAWIVNAPRPSSAALYEPQPARTSWGTPKQRASLAFGARWIQLVALDRQGRSIGQSRRITPKQQRVVGFDLRVGSQGKAWIVWRAGAPSPAAGGGQLSVVLASTAGKSAVYSLRSEGLGAGEPAWLSPGSGAVPWLSFADERDRSVLLPVSSFPLTSEPWQLEQSLQGASALASSGDTLLFALPKGREVELTTGQCGRNRGRTRGRSYSEEGLTPGE